MIFWVTAVVTTVAVLIGLQVTRTYTATAQVMIEPRESRIVDAEKVAPGLPAEDNAIIDTHIRLIQSRASLARAVDNLDLVSDPHFVPSRTARPSLVAGPLALLAGLAARLAGRSAAGPLGARGRHRDRRRAGARFPRRGASRRSIRCGAACG